MRKRGFECVSRFKNQEIHLPKRATQHAAGYDIEAAESITIPSFWKVAVRYALKDWSVAAKEHDFAHNLKEEVMKPTLVPTGLKAYMQEDEYLQLACRSSNPLKRFLMLPNGIGVIDSDYYNNPSNEGEIFVQLLNFGLRDAKIEKGERIAQGIFLPFLKSDDDCGDGKERVGGFGSSGTN